MQHDYWVSLTVLIYILWKKALQNERNENIELRQENADLTQDKKRLNNLLEEKDKNNAQLKSELKDIKSYLRQIREGSKKFLWNQKVGLETLKKTYVTKWKKWKKMTPF